MTKTIMLSEAIIGDLSRNVLGGVASGETIHPTTAPTGCLSRATGSSLSGAVLSTPSQGSGHRWSDCRDVYTSLFTRIGPNGVSCAQTAEDSTVVTPSSRHGGGVNAAMCDGSVRFFTNDIDVGNQAATTADPWPSAIVVYPSPYGVWGALGSIQGGESIGRPE